MGILVVILFVAGNSLVHGAFAYNLGFLWKFFSELKVVYAYFAVGVRIGGEIPT